MIITLWTIILILSILLIIIGRTFNITMSDVCVPAGWVLIFILGMILLFNGVTYATGETETISYEYSIDAFNVSLVNTTSLIRATTYTTFQEGSEPLIAGVDTVHIIGFLLILLGAFGFMTFWFDTKRERREADE